jgi:hypothetical protein
MATEFYNRIPEGIREKLSEYVLMYSESERPLSDRVGVHDLFLWENSPEGDDFWHNHYKNKTFPIWNEEQNRFINP